MKGLRCLLGVHSYGAPVGQGAAQPREDGKMPVECSRCHKGKSITMSGPGFRAADVRDIHSAPPSGWS